MQAMRSCVDGSQGIVSRLETGRLCRVRVGREAEEERWNVAVVERQMSGWSKGGREHVS